MTTTRSRFALPAIAVWLIGCGLSCTARKFDPITLNASGAPGTVDYSGLEAVLKEAVGPNGRIEPDKLKENAKMLEGQLMLMALTGPKTRPDLFKDENAMLNYWYNARAAWSLRLMLTFSRERLKASGQQTAPSDRWKMDEDGISIEEFSGREFPIDGGSMTLSLIDSLLEEKFGYKAVIGAPGVSPARAEMPSEPLAAKNAAILIDKRFNEFIDDDRKLVVDAPSRRILAPAVLWRFWEEILRAHKLKYRIDGANLTTALLHHVRKSPHRRLQDAVGYRWALASEPKVPLIMKREDD